MVTDLLWVLAYLGVGFVCAVVAWYRLRRDRYAAEAVAGACILVWPIILPVAGAFGLASLARRVAERIDRRQRKNGNVDGEQP